MVKRTKPKAKSVTKASYYQIRGFPDPIGPLEHRLIKWNSVPPNSSLNPADVIIHQGMTNAYLLRQRFASRGWATTVIMQDVTHIGPTTAISVGMPEDYSEYRSELAQRWGDDVILRLHVDIWRYQDTLTSQPHVEPDPLYDTVKHLEMYKKKNEIRGSIAVALFDMFFA